MEYIHIVVAFLVVSLLVLFSIKSKMSLSQV